MTILKVCCLLSRNLIFNRHRKNVNEDFYKVTVLAALEEPYDVEEEIDAHNLQEYIDRLIDELPPRRREIFNLSRKEQKSYKEIGRKSNQRSPQVLEEEYHTASSLYLIECILSPISYYHLSNI